MSLIIVDTILNITSNFLYIFILGIAAAKWVQLSYKKSIQKQVISDLTQIALKEKNDKFDDHIKIYEMHRKAKLSVLEKILENGFYSNNK